MHKIVTITVTNDLLTDRRVFKTATYLANKGYLVKIFGRKLDKQYPPFSSNENIKVIRHKLPFNKGKLFYAYYNLLLFFILFFTKKDIMLAVDLDTLLPNFLISKLQRKKLVFDSHEYFTEVPELQNRPFTKKIWLSLEKLLLPHIKNCYTVSPSIATEYNNKYKTNCKVVMNVPYKISNINTAITLPELPKNNKIILYQGALNLGRNIEMMIDAMQSLKEYTLLVVGDGDNTEKLKHQAKKLGLLGNKVIFTGRIPHDKLHSITVKAFLGLSLEDNLGKNYRFALPNKLFDYIMAGVPQIISPLPEMTNIIKQYGTGIVLTNLSPEGLAKAINNITAEQYETMKNNCKKASQILNWENESKKLDSFFI